MRQWANRFIGTLPGDESGDNRRREVTGAAWSRVSPTPVSSPVLLAHAPELASSLGLPPDWTTSPDWLAWLSGNAVPPGAHPYAMNYGGHQFGTWAGQLGDGRAINLGEIRDTSGAWQTLQLKGAGPTPYSRSADGRAVLRSSIREFLCSEAMHHLGVPTTRALSLVGTGEPVVRDMFYDGRPNEEPGAIVCRVAPSFMRFGNFQIHAARQERDLLAQLVHWTIAEHYPELDPDAPDAPLLFLEAVLHRSAQLASEWMRVGFVHGVLNTDNMSVLGLTIDYGPYGWVDHFDPDFTPNTTDANSRRYVFGNQPRVVHWNLAQFARALLPLIEDTEAAQALVDTFPSVFSTAYRVRMARKLGMAELPDETLISRLFAWMQDIETDWTLFFRLLMQVDPEDPDVRVLDGAFYTPPSTTQLEAVSAWMTDWAEAVLDQSERSDDHVGRMATANPWFVPRNYLVWQAIQDAEKGDMSLFDTLFEAVRHPYSDQPDLAHLAVRRPDWARQQAGASMLSCSS
ncbi:MAG: YdiU family protein [Bacteroidetes bacterium]|nr:YdiU family protein [Bacteroidota bacterium]